MKIESFHGDEYSALETLLDAVYPDYPGYVDELKDGDATRQAHLKAARWLAREDERVLGMVEYTQFALQYHPRKFQIDLLVLPDAESRGIGRALYEHLSEALVEFDPLALFVIIREDKPRGQRFAVDRGFSEKMRSWESRLNVAAFDPEPWSPSLASVAEQGIVIKKLSELADDPERDRKLYDLRCAVIKDVPSTSEHTEEGFEQFMERFWKNPALILDACHIAIEGDRYVGYTQLYDSYGASLLYTGLTGVLREYRGRGLATALKVHGINWARSAGKTQIMTWNEVGNEGMLGINGRLGFERHLAWIDYELKIGENSSTGEK